MAAAASSDANSMGIKRVSKRSWAAVRHGAKSGVGMGDGVVDGTGSVGGYRRASIMTTAGR